MPITSDGDISTQTQCAVRIKHTTGCLPEESVAQEQFKGGFTLDANVGWSYRISSGKYLRLNLSVTNILNKTDLRTGGYEQLRIRYDKEGKMMRPFDPRYFYMYGTNYYLNVALVF